MTTVDEWLKAKGHDLGNANDIHAQAMRQYAREQIVKEASEVKPAVEPVKAEQPKPAKK